MKKTSQWFGNLNLATNPLFFIWIGELLGIIIKQIWFFISNPASNYDINIFPGLTRLGLITYGIKDVSWIYVQIGLILFFNILVFVLTLIVSKKYGKWIVNNILIILTIFNIFVVLYI